MRITVGADPELFVRKKRHYISGHIFQCGTKQRPMETKYGHIQVDGIALEANVKPAETPAAFVQNVRGVLSDLKHHVNLHHNDAELVAAPSIFFGSKRLRTLPPEIAKLGCEPDFNAYTGRLNTRPNSDVPFRTGAGHIHVGWTEHQNPRELKFMKKCCQLAKQLDYFLGLPSLLWDDDARRRKLYGCAGAFRPKPYGLEYRVLSNKWVDMSDNMLAWLFTRTVTAVEMLVNGVNFNALYPGVAQAAIDTNYRDWVTDLPDLAEKVLP